MIDVEEVLKQAQKELQEENFRAAVDRAKVKIRERRSFWDRIFPWRIVLVSKEKSDVRRKKSTG